MYSPSGQFVVASDSTEETDVFQLYKDDHPDYCVLVVNVTPFTSGTLDITLKASVDGVNYFDVEDLDPLYQDPDTVGGSAAFSVIIPNVYPYMKFEFDFGGGANMTASYTLMEQKGVINTNVKTDETIMSTVDSFLLFDGGGAGKKPVEIQIINGGTAQLVGLYDVDAEANVVASGVLKRAIYLDANQPGFIKMNDPKVFTQGILVAATSASDPLPASYVAGADLAFAFIEAQS